MEVDYTKIMWLEESPFTIDSFKQKALEYELDLVTFNCWEDAKNALISNVKGWGAIILNPKCKLGRGDRPKPQKFLPQVFCDITSINSKYDVVIPWYVFTDLNPSIFEDMVVKDREVYDGGWERPYYSIEEDSENLFYRIKMQTSSIARTKIREGVHKELFDKMSALTSYGLKNEDITIMEDILISLYENKESKRCNFTNIRIIIEHIVKSMISFNILPDDLRNASNEVNISGCARILCGKPCTSYSHGIQHRYEKDESIIDDIATSNLYNILEICNSGSHSESINGGQKKKKISTYLEITKTDNLLHSCALMLADIIIMYYTALTTIGRDGKRHNFYYKY